MSGFSSLSLTLLLSRRGRGDSSGLLLLEGESWGEGSPSVGSVFSPMLATISVPWMILSADEIQASDRNPLARKYDGQTIGMPR